MKKFAKNTKVGDFINGQTITEVKKSGKVFAVDGTLPADEIEALKIPSTGFSFRPGRCVANIG